MSADVAVLLNKPTQKPSGETNSGGSFGRGGLWSKLKKTINLKDQESEETSVSRKADLHSVYRNALANQINSEGGNQAKAAINPKQSMRMVQLQLAKSDHENNQLNSRPLPKKIVTSSSGPAIYIEQPSPVTLQKRASAGTLRYLSGGRESTNTLTSEGRSKEIRRASTMATISMYKRRESESPSSPASHRGSEHHLPASSPVPEKTSFSISPSASKTGGLQSGKSLWGKIRNEFTPQTAKLVNERPTPKLATFVRLWQLVYEVVKENHMLDFDEPDPKLWWRRVFANMRKKHGKEKASKVVDELLQNPEVLTAIQNKLAGITHQPSHLHSLPKVVRRRIKALKKLQFDMIKLESKFYEELHSLECKYAELYAPILEQRRTIVNGEVEPTDEQCEWPSDDEDDEDLADEAGEKLKIEDKEDSADSDVKGVQDFWLTTLKTVEMLGSMIQEYDEPILGHLTDIKVKYSEQPMGFTLEFHFSPNPFFTDSILTKSYEMRVEPDAEDPFSFEGPEIVACQGCVINWNKGKNVTVRQIKKKQKHQKSGSTRTVIKEELQDSFFNFFSPPEMADPAAGEENDDETEALLQADYEIGHFIRERIVPRAVLFYTGEAIDDEDYAEIDEEDEEDYDDDDEDGDDDEQMSPGGPKGDQNCKQQ